MSGLSWRIAGAVLLMLCMAPAGPARAAQSSSETAEQTFSEISGCVSTSDSTDILFVVDESQSLVASDPEDKRVDALKIAIDGVANLQKSAPDKDVRVAAATFATDFTVRVPWGAADDDGVKSLKSFADGDVPQLESGQGTDYLKALVGARRELTARDADCKIVLWFTDGGLDVADSESATEDAYQDICDKAAVIDALRAKQIYVVALALFNRNSNITDRDRARLQAIAEGGGAGGEKCGTVPVAERSAGGAYLPAEDAGRLAQVFGGAMSRIEGYTQNDEVVCDGPDCPDGVLTVPVDPGVSKMRISVYPTAGTPQVKIGAPGAEPQPVDAGTSRVGAAPTSVSLSKSSTQIDLDVRDDANVGDWKVVVTGGSAWVESWLSPELEFVLTDESVTLAAEESTEVGVRLVDARGEPANLKEFTLQGPEAQVTGAGEVTVKGGGDAGWVIDVPPVSGSSLPRSRLVQIELGLTSKPSDIPFEPLVGKFDLPVSTSAAYPQVVAEELVFPDTSEPGPVTADLELQGSSEGPAKVCFEPADMIGPDGEILVAPAPGVLDRDGCMELGQGESTAVTFEAQPDVVSDGEATGTVVVKVNSARDGDPALTVDVPSVMSLSRPVDQVKRGLLFWLLMVAALVLPILIVWLLGKRRLAKFAAGDIRHCSVAVTVHQEGDEYSLRTPGRGALVIPASEAGWMPITPNQTDVRHNRLRFTAIFELFGPHRLLGRFTVPWLKVAASARAELLNPGSQVMASHMNPYRHGVASAPADLRLQRNWFLVASASAVKPDEGFPATLIAFGKGADFPAIDMPDRASPLVVKHMVHALRTAAREVGKQQAQPLRTPADAGGTTSSAPPSARGDDDEWL